MENNLAIAALDYLKETRDKLRETLPSSAASAVFSHFAKADFSSVATAMASRNEVANLLEQENVTGGDEGEPWTEFYSAIVGATFYLNVEQIAAVLLEKPSGQTSSSPLS